MATLLPARYDFPPAVANDTFPGLPLTLNFASAPAALASARLQFRKNPAAGGAAELELTSADGDISIGTPGATSWAVTIDPFGITLGVGNWHYDLEFTDADGAVSTLLAGRWRIVQDVTK